MNDKVRKLELLYQACFCVERCGIADQLKEYNKIMGTKLRQCDVLSKEEQLEEAKYFIEYEYVETITEGKRRALGEKLAGIIDRTYFDLTGEYVQ